ncbi:multidrug efflux pump-associated protein, AcrZ family, partial [Salmonella enterica subsp. enterica serovar Montevideo]|nr:multidrug efflux pump-associated protein, AcrZ family [Salmonella enterica subsp. enterica serovar Montevideo]
RKTSPDRTADFPKRPLSRAFLLLKILLFLPIFSVFNR